MRILIVEDEPAYVDALTVALEREGYESSAVFDGRSAVVSFLSDPPDLVLLDLMLPEMSGLDVLRRMRQESAVPVIVLSAKDAESDIVTALELGADDYLSKPYSIRELLARIRARIETSADRCRCRSRRGPIDRRCGGARPRSVPAAHRRHRLRSAA